MPLPFAKLLRSARRRLGLSQAKAAAHVSPLLSVRTVQHWEAGNGEPPPWAQDLILRAFPAPNDADIQAAADDDARRASLTFSGDLTA